MSIFDVDYNQQTPELLPPDKRDSPRVSLVSALIMGVQWCRDLIVGSYASGSLAADYSPGTYPQFAQVVFNKSVYYSLFDGNTSDPTDATKWLRIQDNFLGVSERVKFNGQNLVLEYALNKRFDGTFRPPPSVTPSDIYMLLLASTIGGFNVGETTGSSVGQTTSSDFIGSISPIIRVNNFEVKVLDTIFATTNEQEIRDFINQYIPAGINYIITTYP